MNRFHRLLFLLSLAGVCLVLYFALVSPYRERLAASHSARSINIPVEQDAYRILQAFVARSNEEWQAYLGKLKATEMIFQIFEENGSWDRWPAFEDAVRNANVSYPDEVLVIVPYKRGSSSVQHSTSALRLASRKLWFNVSRSNPSQQTRDMNFGCYTFAIKAAEVDQVEMRVDGVPRTIINLK